jgi:hypothetical protein
MGLAWSTHGRNEKFIQIYGRKIHREKTFSELLVIEHEKPA